MKGKIDEEGDKWPSLCWLTSVFSDTDQSGRYRWAGVGLRPSADSYDVATQRRMWERGTGLLSSMLGTERGHRAGGSEMRPILVNVCKALRPSRGPFGKVAVIMFRKVEGLVR